jgi:hypothetical protein
MSTQTICDNCGLIFKPSMIPITGTVQAQYQTYTTSTDGSSKPLDYCHKCLLIIVQAAVTAGN